MIFLRNSDIKFNISKCSFLRVGMRYTKNIVNFKLGLDKIKCSDSITYLDACFKEGKCFKFTYSLAKCGF